MFRPVVIRLLLRGECKGVEQRYYWSQVQGPLLSLTKICILRYQTSSSTYIFVCVTSPPFVTLPLISRLFCKMI